MSRTRPKIEIVPSRTSDGVTPAGSGYVRLLLPYTNDTIRRHCTVGVSGFDNLSGDVIIFQREVPNISARDVREKLGVLKNEGVRIVYDIDDNLLDKDGLQARGYSREEADEAGDKVAMLLEAADLVTVSNDRLEAKMRDVAANVRIVPNRLSASLWQTTRRRRTPGTPVRIGYMGTRTHEKDLALIREAAVLVEEKFGADVRFEIIGGSRDGAGFGEQVALPGRNAYPFFVHWLKEAANWDIGMVPLVDDEFNQYKSFLKYLEYSALGAAAIASNMSVYNEIITHGENGLLAADDPQDWVESITSLVRDRERRERLASAAADLLAADYAIEAAEQYYLDNICAALGMDMAELENHDGSFSRRQYHASIDA
ncbi:glycosyltransferase [Aquisalinus flavus]|uniref:Glycosyltransferase n=1 Tax=Aquisalinus flavus TaxID=1526572 RepID=A0A8J2Y7Y9_9PROT|nr:glycosyltransferase [Aquisalinus flavus]MBD0426216.1 glycosyltransferase [Aquisalinus flavus]GGD09669.1 hypothetical protein GCM10011342_18220 [Aquisalinus flavus]